MNLSVRMIKRTSSGTHQWGPGLFHFLGGRAMSFTSLLRIGGLDPWILSAGRRPDHGITLLLIADRPRDTPLSPTDSDRHYNVHSGKLNAVDLRQVIFCRPIGR